MSTIEKKLDALRHWRYQEQRSPFPERLFPSYNDMDALLHKETPAMLYFCELLYEMIEEIERLHKLVEGKAS